MEAVISFLHSVPLGGAPIILSILFISNRVELQNMRNHLSVYDGQHPDPPLSHPDTPLSLQTRPFPTRPAPLGGLSVMWLHVSAVVFD